MAPSSKSEKDDGKQKAKRKHKDHVVKLLMRGKLAGQFSQRLFRKLPPRVCVPLRTLHVFLGFTKCGRYILSYTSDCGEDDDFSFYTYHLYWWEFKPVHHVRLFAGEEIYSDLYLTVCEWPNDHSKIVIFVLMNLMMSDENNRDIYITIASMPPPKPCSYCCPVSFSHFHTRYQVVYPFPTFQPAFQLKKDQVILLNTSYSLVACGISLCPAALSSQASPSFSSTSLASSSIPQGSPESRLPPSKPAPIPSSPSQSQAAVRAREFAADLFRRAQGGGEKEKEDGSHSVPQCSEQVMSPASCSSSPSSPSSSQEGGPSEPGYVNYSRLHYRLQQPGTTEQNAGYEDDKVQLPFTVTDLKGRNLQLVTGPHSGQVVCVEQLTLDFEYLINEFCSFSDYDCCDIRGQCVLKPNTVMINIGLLLLAFSNSDEEHCRPNTYHSNLQVSWDLNTGVCCTVGVGDLTEVKGQTSGSVWSSYRKSCVNTVMKWLVPESSSRYINRMTNEALHKGSSLQVLADSDRCTWIVL
uniref:DDB1 and CUL4 associated factor 15 n=1 Tax=Cyclopterus lumpus TaxID=8103 RepID=A0A8C2ZIN6_CYCLU